jgi:hypothetical protein
MTILCNRFMPRFVLPFNQHNDDPLPEFSIAPHRDWPRQLAALVAAKRGSVKPADLLYPYSDFEKLWAAPESM